MRPDDQVALEATGNASAVAVLLDPHVAKVVISNPVKTRAIAEAKVKVHMKAILRKIRVHNRTQAAIWGMNNRSPARTTNTDSPPLVPLRASGLPAPTATISEIKQTDESIQPRATEREANHAGVPRLDRLIRKGGARLRE